MIRTKPLRELVIKKFPHKYSNTSPLGLIGFGFTTILLSFANISVFNVNSMIIGLGLFYGGVAQFMAGIYEIKQHNTFGGTAFCSYGAFWLSFCVMIFGGPVLGVASPDENAEGCYLLFWCIFTILMFFATLKHAPVTLRIIFASLAITFLFLSIGAFAEKKVITKVGGGFGLFCGAVAFYCAIAQVINGEFGETVLPI